MKKKLFLSLIFITTTVLSEEVANKTTYENQKLEINTSYGKTLNDMGSYYASKTQYELAERFYKESIKNEKNPVAYFNLGLLYRKMKKREESAEYFKKAYELTKKTEILEHLGHIYAVMGEYDESMYKISLDYFKKAYDKGYMDGKYNYAAMLEKLGDTEKAKEIFNSLLETDKLGDSYFHLGKIYFREKNYDKSLQHYLKSAELNNKYAYNEVAVIYDFYDNYVEAEKYYKKSVEVSKSKKALENYGKMMKEQNRETEYLAYASKFKEDYFDQKY